MNKIKGKDVILEIFKDGVYVPFICSTSCSIHIKPELINKTTMSSGRWNEYQVRRFDWSVDLSGVSVLENSWTTFMTFNIVNIIAGFQIRMTFTDTVGNTAVFTGKVFLEDGSISGDVDDFSMFEDTMRGSGAYTLVTTIGGTPVGGGIGSMVIGSSNVIG